MSGLRRPTIVLLGMLTKMPFGGVAWLVAQYAVGFERLGYDVYYVEAHARTPSMFVSSPEEDGSEQAAAYLANLMARIGLHDRWALHALHSDGRCYGMSDGELMKLYRDADLIVNMHGGTVPLPEHASTGRLVLLGTDPVELELELASGLQRSIDFVETHSAHFTWGLNYGNPDCPLPWASKYGFVPSPPPIVADFWANNEHAAGAPFTTVGNWRQPWRELHFNGEVYRWSKHHEFMRIIDLPKRSSAAFELALSSYEPSDESMLNSNGWKVRSGVEVSSDADSYRRYIQQSRGEFTVAKDQNIRFRSGWFSERSATYLAAGRPVIMQDTGFGNALPTGEGLLTFTDLDSAIAAVETVISDEKRHRAAATDIAREYLNYDVVLPAILDHVGLPVAHRRRPVRPTDPAPMMLPTTLDLAPLSRRPLVLAPITTATVLARPVPALTLPPRRPEHGPRASIVVPVFDNPVVTRIALESILALTEDFELLVVDNGSQAQTQQYLQVLASRNSQVRLIRNATNLGFARAVNQGLSVARGEVLVIANNDTLVTPGWLEILCARLRDRSVGIVGPSTNRCGNEAEVPCDYTTLGELLAFASQPRGDAFDLKVAIMFVAAMRRDVFETVGLLDERFDIGMFEDDDYSRRVREAGFRIVCEPASFVHHFGEASIGLLAAAGTYGTLFDSNRAKFEAKWGEPWQGHQRTAPPGYAEVVGRVLHLISEAVPPGASVLVTSKGDEALVNLPGRTGRHFPAEPDGVFSGHHPADDAEAIARLEQARSEGADYLVITEPVMWWLAHYIGFAAHLAAHYREVAHEQGTAVVFALDDSGSKGNPE